LKIFSFYTTLTTFLVLIVLLKCVLRLVENFTVPEMSEKMVWSLPRRTPLPGKTSVPRWRIKTEPACALSPSVILTPRYFGPESLPFCVEPADFLCAISVNYFEKIKMPAKMKIA